MDEAPSPPDAPSTAPRVDRWAHRRGEPRVFALLWTIYLLFVCLLTVLRPAENYGLDVELTRFPARLLASLIGVGVVVVWPMIRLAQAAPERPIRSALVDFAVVVLPAQMVLWPAAIFGRWSLEVTACLGLSLAAWAAFAASIVAAGARSRADLDRAAWMFLCSLVTLVPPMLAIVSRAPADRAWLLALSPATAPFAMTAQTGGSHPMVEASDWVAAAAPALLAAPFWAFAAWSARPSRRV